MTFQYIRYPSTGGGGGVNIYPNFASLPGSAPDGTLAVVQDTGYLYEYHSGAWVVIGGPGVVLSPNTFSPNTFAGFDNAGALESIPGFSIDTTTQGMVVNLDNHPNNAADGQTINQFNANIEPLQDSPNDTRGNVVMNINGDASNLGFNTGNLQNLNLNMNVGQSGSAGSLSQLTMYNNIGDGTDPITIKGVTYAGAFGDYNDNVTIDGGIQGFTFNPNIHSGVAITTSYNVNAFADFSNIAIPVSGHTSFQASPSIQGIVNNNNYTGVNVNPNIATFTGNASMTALFAGGIISTMSATGNYQGLDISPQISTSHGNITGVSINQNIAAGDANYQGIDISPSGTATLPNVRGITINLGNIATSDVNGPIGLETDSRISVNGSLTASSGQFIQIGSRIEHAISIAPGSPLTGTDILGLDIAGDLLAQDNMAVGPLGIGFNSVGFIADMAVAVGKTIDLLHVFLPAVALPDPGFTTGGTVTDMEFIHVQGPLIQGGSLVTTNLYGFRVMPDFSTTTSPTSVWGVSVEDPGSENFLAKSLAIKTSSKKVSNLSTALEIGGTTSTFRNAVLTTTQRNALTPLEGMQVWNTTTGSLEQFNGVSWTGFANRSLSNLTTTAINQSLIPDTDNNYLLGSNSFSWTNLHTWGANFYDTTSRWWGAGKSIEYMRIQASDSTLFTTPSGLIAVSAVLNFHNPSGTASDTLLSISTTSGNSANPSGKIAIETGNNAGAGASGDIILQTGTSGGTRGVVHLNGSAINAHTTQIHNVVDPTAAQDAATKNYVDTVASQLQPIQAVFAASVATVAGTYVNGAAGIGATFTTTSTSTFTLDGYTPTLSQRVLLKNQTSGFQNGVYTVTQLATGVLPAILTRSLDYDTSTDIDAGNLVPVINGTVNTQTSWLQTATVTTVGTDALVFAQWTANPASYLLKTNNLSDVSSKPTSFNNLSPMTTAGDLIYGGASGAGTRLPIGSTGNYLTVTGGVPVWTAVIPGAIRSQIRLSAGGLGSASNNKVAVFTNLLLSTGSDITWTSDTVNGDTFTINTDGVYSITMHAGGSGLVYGFTVNNSSTTTSIYSLPDFDILMSSEPGPSFPVCTYTGIFSATDVVRCQTNGGSIGTSANDLKFTICRIS